jgi:hypothetical protein
MVGACQYKILNVPPLPRFVAGAAGAVVAAGAAGLAGSAGLAGAGVGLGAQAAKTNEVAAVRPSKVVNWLLFINTPLEKIKHVCLYKIKYTLK